MPLRVQATLVFGVKVSRWAKTPLSSGVTVVVTTGIRQDQQAELKEVQLQYREGTAVPSVSHVSFSVRGTWGLRTPLLTQTPRPERAVHLPSPSQIPRGRTPTLETRSPRFRTVQRWHRITVRTDGRREAGALLPVPFRPGPPTWLQILPQLTQV